MQVEVNKNELAGALVALGKLICRTSPVEAYYSVQIVWKENLTEKNYSILETYAAQKFFVMFPE